MGNKLYIGNLPYSATEDSLTNKFSECGMVSSVKVVMDNDSGRSKGFAFVEMSSGSEAQDVIYKFNGVDYDGREMKISEAKPMQKKAAGSSYSRKGW